jgi:Domain of unknown function (DUF4190)
MTVQGGDSGEQGTAPSGPRPVPNPPSFDYPPSGPPPGGHRRPSYQGGGYLPPGYGGRYVQQSQTNAMAIGSLIASVVGLLVPFGSIVGIVLGSVAINRIKKTRQPGYGMAVVGIAIGIATLVTYVVFAIHFRGHLPS